MSNSTYVTEVEVEIPRRAHPGDCGWSAKLRKSSSNRNVVDSESPDHVLIKQMTRGLSSDGSNYVTDD